MAYLSVSVCLSLLLPHLVSVYLSVWLTFSPSFSDLVCVSLSFSLSDLSVPPSVCLAHNFSLTECLSACGLSACASVCTCRFHQSQLELFRVISDVSLEMKIFLL